MSITISRNRWAVSVTRAPAGLTIEETRGRVRTNLIAILSDDRRRAKAQKIDPPTPSKLKALPTTRTAEYGVGRTISDSGVATAYIDLKAKKVYVREKYTEVLPWENITSVSTNWYAFDLAKLTRP